MSTHRSPYDPRPASRFLTPRELRRQARGGRRPTPVAEPPTLADVADDCLLIATFHELARAGGQARGGDGLTYRDFGRDEVAHHLRQVARRIRAGTYAPQPPRQHRIPKPAGGHRTLSIPTVIDRAVYAALHRVVGPYLDPRLSPRSHGFRPGRGVSTLLAALEVEAIARGAHVLAVDDVRRAFDAVDTAAVVDAHRRHLTDPGVLGLVEVVIRGHGGRERRTGIDQGGAYSPLAMNVTLDAVHDTPLSERGRLWHRYADNVVYLAHNLTEGEQLRAETDHLLSGVGLRLKGMTIVDLHAGGEVELLGMRIGTVGDAIVYRTDPAAWGHLEMSLREAHAMEDPPATALAVVRGWVQAQGAALETWTDADTHRLLDLCHGYSCAEGICAADIRRMVTSGVTGWRATRDRAACAFRIAAAADRNVTAANPNGADGRTETGTGSASATRRA